MDEPGLPRPKRRCAQRQPQNLPIASHYVGYVEEDETPEMIMKKFEELERVMQRSSVPCNATTAKPCHARQLGTDCPPDPHAACLDGTDQKIVQDAAEEVAVAADVPLDEAALLEVFKRTR